MEPSHDHPRLAASQRRAFTVVEVMVALTIGSLLLIGARAMLGAIASSADMVQAEAAALDREANAERLLRSLLRQVEAASDSQEFGGNQRAVRFSTWCTVADGWQQRCRSTVSIAHVHGEPALVATLSTGEVVVLERGFRAAELRYVGEARRGGTWFEVWGEGITLPVALGVLLERDSVTDTLILRLGVR